MKDKSKRIVRIFFKINLFHKKKKKAYLDVESF